MEERVSIRSFTDLKVWQKAHSLVLILYKITKKFPPDEQFGLTSQMRRAVVSITSNIAEGFSRQGFREKVQFYYMALGSLTEAQNQLVIARDLGYLNHEEFGDIAQKVIDVHKLLNAFISSTKSYILDSRF